MTRSSTPSSTSTLSCIHVETHVAEPASSTPPTSVTDNGSVSSKSFVRDNDGSFNGRAKRARNSLVSYNENVLSGRPAMRKRKSINSTRNSNIAESSTMFDHEAQQLVHDSIEALDIGWDVDSLPLGRAPEPKTTAALAKSRQRADSTLLNKATSALNRVTSALGKRSRDAMESSVNKMQILGKRASLRVRQQSIKQEEAPAEKKLKLVEQTKVVETSTTAAPARKAVKIPTAKRWLAKGLYVGQDPDFDPRMTDTKNKLKKASSAKSEARQRTVLPLPMFAGKRLLDNGRAFQLPYDVFNPLPNGQPKPEEWRKVGKNVFIGDSGEIWRHTKLTEMSKCLCMLDTGCDDDCINRTMFYECDNSNCNVGVEHCGNRSFEELRKRVKAGGKYNIGVEVVKTKDKGYGVRSNRTFHPNQIIVEYTGEIITPEECDRRMYDEYKNNECFYLMVFDQNMIIDATRGSIARFVNHSCESNCKMVKWTVAGKPRMALFAGDQGIMTGEELTYDYNFDPFSSKNIQGCRCGKPSCRGVLGPRPKPDIKEVKEITKTTIVKTSTKRKITEDDGIEIEITSVKKRKTAVARSMKQAISSVKATATRQLNKAKEKKSTTTKKLADRSSKAIGRPKTKRSNVRFQTRGMKPAAAPTPLKKHARVTAAGTIKRGVVRTMKGKAGGGRGRTIRIIDD